MTVVEARKAIAEGGRQQNGESCRGANQFWSLSER